MEEKLLSEDEKSARLLSKIQKVVHCGVALYAVMTIVQLVLNIVNGVTGTLDYVSFAIKGLVLLLSLLSFAKIGEKIKKVFGGLTVIVLFLSSILDIVSLFLDGKTLVPLSLIIAVLSLGLGIIDLLVATPSDSFIAIKPNEKHKHDADYWVQKSSLGILVSAIALLVAGGLSLLSVGEGPSFLIYDASRFIFLIVGLIIFIFGLICTFSKSYRRKKEFGISFIVLAAILLLSGLLYAYVLKSDSQSTGVDKGLPFLLVGLVYEDILVTFVFVTFFASKVLPPLPPKAPKPVVHKEKPKPVVVPEHKEAAKAVAPVNEDVVWTGTPKELFFFLLHYGLLNAITFGIYTPWFICHFLEFYYERSTFDGRHYTFEAGGKDLFHAGWKWVLFTALTFGIYAFWAFGHFMQWKNLHTKEVKAD